jgi:ComF family protein
MPFVAISSFRELLFSVSASVGGSQVVTVANVLATVLLAARCAACDRILDAPLAGPVCEDCWGAIRAITPPVCDCCGDPLAFSLNRPPSDRAARAPRQCLRCGRSARPVDRSRAIGEYDGALRAIVHALKYDGRRSVARRLAALMRSRGADVLEQADLVVPVPLHRRRHRERGFNQAAELSQYLGLPVCGCLERRRYTESQMTLPAERRHANVRDAFTVSRRVRVAGRRILIVDDVSTTGATLDACALALKAAGARQVHALTAARVVSRPR